MCGPQAAPCSHDLCKHKHKHTCTHSQLQSRPTSWFQRGFSGLASVASWPRPYRWRERGKNGCGAKNTPPGQPQEMQTDYLGRHKWKCRDEVDHKNTLTTNLSMFWQTKDSMNFQGWIHMFLSRLVFALQASSSCFLHFSTSVAGCAIVCCVHCIPVGFWPWVSWWLWFCGESSACWSTSIASSA